MCTSTILYLCIDVRFWSYMLKNSNFVYLRWQIDSSEWEPLETIRVHIYNKKTGIVFKKTSKKLWEPATHKREATSVKRMEESLRKLFVLITTRLEHFHCFKKYIWKSEVPEDHGYLICFKLEIFDCRCNRIIIWLGFFNNIMNLFPINLVGNSAVYNFYCLVNLNKKEDNT